MGNEAGVSDLMNQVSRYIAQTRKRRLPEHIAARAKLHLVDTFAAMLSGSRLLPGKRGIAYVESLGGRCEAGVIGTRMLTSTLNAALANGMCGHADETDDTHPATRTHPGTSIVPAALALAERDRLSGQAFLRAMVVGYEMCARSMLVIKAMPLMRTGHHAGARGQLFGAAAAAPCSLSSTREESATCCPTAHNRHRVPVYLAARHATY